MFKNASALYALAKKAIRYGTYGIIIILKKFYDLVKTGGPWDLKNKKEWKLNKGDYFIFNNLKLRADDPGNIHFGYVGSVLFSKPTLRMGAGMYQIYSGTSRWKYFMSYFDDPRDSAFIRYGVSLWTIYYKRYVFHI